MRLQVGPLGGAGQFSRNRELPLYFLLSLWYDSVMKKFAVVAQYPDSGDEDVLTYETLEDARREQTACLSEGTYGAVNIYRYSTEAGVDYDFGVIE